MKLYPSQHPSPLFAPVHRKIYTCNYIPLTFQLRSARTKLHTPSDRQATSFSKFRNVIWNLFGQHSFSFIAPSVWNSLPASLWNISTVSGFKTRHKTFLFRQACSQTSGDPYVATDYVYVHVYTGAWMGYASASRFSFAKRFSFYKSVYSSCSSSYNYDI